jgi:hypothetical protein
MTLWRSPFVDDSDHPPAQPQVPDGYVLVPIDELASIRTSLKFAAGADNPHVEYIDFLLTASGKGE